MPTGYTEAIKDGIEFSDFVMNCARAMGACIIMRDDPSDKKIPERFEPTDYHIKKLADIESEIDKIKRMTPEQAEKAAQKEFQAAMEQREKTIAKHHELRSKYEAMLRDVKAWEPPTSDHRGLKNFMIEQITSSISFDCDVEYCLDHQSVRSTGTQWVDQKLTELFKSMDYHHKENEEEISRTEGRNQWLKKLRESLPRSTPDTGA